MLWVKLPPGMPHPVADTWVQVPSLLSLQLPANAYPGGQWMVAQGHGPLPLTWETQVEFWALDFGLA